MELFKQERAAEEQRNRDNGTPGNFDLIYSNNLHIIIIIII
jgi:hypothetical protein